MATTKGLERTCLVADRGIKKYSLPLDRMGLQQNNLNKEECQEESEDAEANPFYHCHSHSEAHESRKIEQCQAKRKLYAASIICLIFMIAEIIGEYSSGLPSRKFHIVLKTQPTVRSLKRPLEATFDLALPPGALQPLPKRPALEKNNGASTVFNPNVFHYQQALANMQLQQPAFIPTVPMMHGATPTTVSAATAPATSVPFAATATANQISQLSVDELSSSMFVSQM